MADILSGMHREEIAEAVRAHTGRGGRSVAELAKATGITGRRIYELRDQEGEMTASELLALGRELPSSFLADLLEPVGVTSVAKGDDVADVAGGAHTLARLTQEASHLAVALEDGVIDHRERAQLVPAFQRLRDDLDGFLAGLRGKDAVTDATDRFAKRREGGA